MTRAALAASAAFAIASCSPSPHAPSPAPPSPPRVDWLGKSIYFVVTDRFANGDPTNDDADGFRADLADHDAWHGGDFRGLADHLDYIAGMGFTAIWITPIIRQHDRHAYHGYWGWNFHQLDPHLGDDAALTTLIDRAHQRGLAVMLDTVANHTGRYDDHAPSFPAPTDYHHHGDIKNFDDPVQLETYDLAGLNDLDQGNPRVRAILRDSIRWQVHAFGFDGIRVDTAKHVPQDFLRDYAHAANVFAIGEVLHGDVDVVAPYTRVLDAVLDYPLYFKIRDVFALGTSARALGDVLAQDGKYAHGAGANGVFVDNHDQPRFLCASTAASADAKLADLRLALAFAFTTRGLPILYYGTEQAFGDCTVNRADMAGRFDTHAPLYAYVAQLNRARAASAALRTGTQHERWRDDTAYAFERVPTDVNTDDDAIVIFNLDHAPRTFTLHALAAAANTTLHDALDPTVTATVDATRTLTLTLPPRTARILTTTAGDAVR